MSNSLRVELVTGPDACEAAFAIRRHVFIDEQGVAEDEEFDEFDATAVHALVYADDRAVGTGRLLEIDGKGRIGRMAVLREFRGRGVGLAILDALLAVADRLGYTEIVLHAQVHAIGFYETRGFRAHGPEFTEAAIPHRVMRRRLPL